MEVETGISYLEGNPQLFSKTLSVHTLIRDFSMVDSAKWECRSRMGGKFGL